MAGTFTYLGESFSFSDEVDPFALVEFAEALDAGLDADGLHGLAVIWRMALSCVAEDDRQRFRQASRREKVTAEVYMKVIQQRLADDTARPTGAPGDSSPGPAPIEVSSAPAHAVSVTPLPARRPDLALAASRARTA